MTPAAEHDRTTPPTHHTDAKAKSRRARARIRLAALTTAPVWLSRGRLARVRHDRKLTPIHRDILLPDLPDALDSLRIAHLSDLHIGRLTTPAHLPWIIEACQQLDPHLIAVTGDFVDFSLSVLDEVIHALRRLSAPLGVYLVPGNHDYLDDGPELIRRLRGSGLRLMLNESCTLELGGAKLTVAGIDFPHRRSDLARFVHRTLSRSSVAPRHADHVLKAKPRPATRDRVHRGRHPEHRCDLKVLLSHHPDAFDAATRHGVDLTLAGHTHGGQFVLADTNGKRGSIGLGALAFKYPRGLYRRGNSYLYVNSGVGSWFPLRVKCPAEVACLTLRAGEPVPRPSVF